MRWRWLGKLVLPILVLFGFWATASPAQAHDDPGNRIVPRYPSYPYSQHTKGYVKRVPEKETGDEETKLWSVRAAAEGGYLGNRGWRAGGRALLRYWRVGLSAEAHYYDGRATGVPMYLGTGHTTVDLVMRSHFGLRVGPGLNARVDARYSRGSRPSYEIGPGLMTEVDIFPVHPVVASARFDVGRLGDSTFVSGRASVGVLIRRLEIYLAYEAKLVGEVPLRGPHLGLRAWF